MRAVLTILTRDLRARLRDRSALVMALLAPAALITILSMLSAGPDTDKIPVGLADPGSTSLGSALAQGPLAALEDDGTIRLTTYDDEAALRRAIDDDDVDAGLVVADDGRRLLVLHGAGDIVAGAIAEGAGRSTALTVDGVTLAVAAQQPLGGTATPQQLAAALATAPDPARVTDATGTTGIDPKTQIAVGMATFFLFFSAQFGVLGLLQEKRQGTLPRLLVAPVAPWQVLLAKVLVSVVIGLASMTSLALFSSWLLGADWGDPLGVGVLLVSGVLAAVATATLVIGLAKTAEQAGAAMAVVALVLGILGGSFFSMARAGGIAAVATRFTPHFWVNEGLVRLTGGQPWTAVGGPVAVLLTMTVLIGVPGLLLARRTVRP